LKKISLSVKKMERFFVSPEVFLPANSLSCYWQKERVQVGEKDLYFFAGEFFRPNYSKALGFDSSSRS
jgi:hypothetical protein